MRSRLTVSFVLISFVVLSAFAAIRFGALRDLLRDQEIVHVQQDAAVLAEGLNTWLGAGRKVDSDVVRSLVADDAQVRVVIKGRAPLELTGPGYVEGAGGGVGPLEASATRGSVSVTVRESGSVVRDVLVSTSGSIAALALLLVVLAGTVGYFAARLMSAPFQKLALAATALGRGRSDLDLPTSRVPEVRIVADSLEASATRMRNEITRDQDFLLDASHRLRTPMTGMRLELEELQLDAYLDPEVRKTVDRSIAGLDELQELTTAVFALARANRGSFTDAQITIEQLAQQTADSWAAALAERHLRVRATVEGELDQRLMPGPVEQVLDRVLVDVLRSARGCVDLAFTGSGEQVGIAVHAVARSRRAASERVALAPVQQMVEALAGRCTGDPLDGGIRIWLPRR